jgi:hypothetical protein
VRRRKRDELEDLRRQLEVVRRQLEVVRTTLRVVRGERDSAQGLLWALRLAGHVPEGGWSRYVNGAVYLDSEGDIARADARAMEFIGHIERSDAHA